MKRKPAPVPPKLPQCLAEVQYEIEGGQGTPSRSIHYCIFFKGHKGPHLISRPSEGDSDE